MSVTVTERPHTTEYLADARPFNTDAFVVSRAGNVHIVVNSVWQDSAGQRHAQAPGNERRGFHLQLFSSISGQGSANRHLQIGQAHTYHLQLPANGIFHFSINGGRNWPDGDIVVRITCNVRA